MKIQLRRFAILAVVGSVLASALVAGCGGSSDDTSTAPAGGGAGANSAAGNKAGGNSAGGNTAAK